MDLENKENIRLTRDFVPNDSLLHALQALEDAHRRQAQQEAEFYRSLVRWREPEVAER